MHWQIPTSAAGLEPTADDWVGISAAFRIQSKKLAPALANLPAPHVKALKVALWHITLHNMSKGRGKGSAELVRVVDGVPNAPVCTCAAMSEGHNRDDLNAIMTTVTEAECAKLAPGETHTVLTCCANIQ